MSERARLQRDGRAAVAGRRQGLRPCRCRTPAPGNGPAGAGISARNGSSRRPALRRPPSWHQTRSDCPPYPQVVPCREMVAGSALRVVFFGTPEFAVPTLDALLQSAHAVVGVVSQPDRPRGRGHKTSAGAVTARASAAGVPVLQPASLRDESFLRQLRGLQCDLGVVAAYGRILTEAVLGIPRLGLINVHASLLP